MNDEIIFIKLDLFRLNQTVYIQDKIGIKNTRYVVLDDLPEFIGYLANDKKISNVKIIGQKDFSLPIAEDIRTYCVKNYSNNYINIEIIEGE